MWLCDLFEHASMLDKIIKAEWLEIDDAYVPQPTLVVAIDEHVWIQVLSTIDVSALSKGAQFCDDMGNDIIVLCTMEVCPNENFILCYKKCHNINFQLLC